jgi:hypothetical protein
MTGSRGLLPHLVHRIQQILRYTVVVGAEFPHEHSAEAALFHIRNFLFRRADAVVGDESRNGRIRQVRRARRRVIAPRPALRVDALFNVRAVVPRLTCTARACRPIRIHAVPLIAIKRSSNVELAHRHAIYVFVNIH